MADPADITVTLAWSEVMQAALVAQMRRVQNMAAGRNARFGAERGDGWGYDIEGACGEMAVAKHFGLYWSGAVGNLRAPDVGPLQVRTRAKPYHDLILHPSDANDDAFVLVTGLAPTFRLIGWTVGHDGKRDEYWADPAGGRPAFFVPQAALKPIAALRQILERAA